MENLIQNILIETKYKENPYFTALRDGSFTKEDFVETQIQFYSAVVFFHHPMSALAAKIPNEKLRAEILKNVREENGEGNPNHSHGATFLEFLSRLDSVTQKYVERCPLLPVVSTFNTALTHACTSEDYLVGAAVMGIIERMFCDISSIIAESAIARKWITPEKMIHYDLHKDLDVRHSADFFNVLEPAWNSSLKTRAAIEQGLRTGAEAFNSLYLGLYHSRKAR